MSITSEAVAEAKAKAIAHTIVSGVQLLKLIWNTADREASRKSNIVMTAEWVKLTMAMLEAER